MNTLDPAVRDLLAAIHGALDAAELRDYPVCAAQTAIRSALAYGDLDADWLVAGPMETADARRVRRADARDLYQTSRQQEVPA